MLAYYIPIAVVVFSNTLYQICAKSVPSSVSPFLSLTVTYTVAALASLALYFVTGKGDGLVTEFGKLNWASFVLGLVIIGLEGGFLYVYKAGWQVNTAAVVQSCFLAASLLIVGRLLFHEPITASKLIGVTICAVGLYFVNS